MPSQRGLADGAIIDVRDLFGLRTLALAVAAGQDGTTGLPPASWHWGMVLQSGGLHVRRSRLQHTQQTSVFSWVVGSGLQLGGDLCVSLTR
jgi:hypothetical protein